MPGGPAAPGAPLAPPGVPEDRLRGPRLRLTGARFVGFGEMTGPLPEGAGEQRVWPVSPYRHRIGNRVIRVDGHTFVSRGGGRSCDPDGDAGRRP